MSEALAELRRGLRTLAEAVDGLEFVDEGLRVGLRPRGPSSVAIEIDTEEEPDWIALFADFEFRIRLDEEYEAELVEDVLDFAAAAIFGELRVVEESRGRALRQTLEVRVGDRWRRHASSGRLGLRALLGVERRVHVNAGIERPPALRAAGPSGLPSAPWHGAAGLGLLAEAAPLPLDGELDLHNFSPKQVAPLVREYIAACREAGVLELRVVHGKGKGVLRRTVHSLLDKHAAVADYRLGGHGEGSWGATVVTLRPREPSEPESQ